jgi:hypothetical protein
MKVYISGKISGLSKYEYLNNFDVAECTLRFEHDVVTVYNPTDLRPLFGLDWYWCYMVVDLYYMILKADTIYLLSNWHDSKGAKIELFFAILFRKKVYLERKNEWQN